MTKAKAAIAFQWVVVIGVALWLGFMAGFYHATGGLPMGIGQGESIVPPGIETRTGAEARQAIEPLQTEQYRDGFNCLDYAWAGMRLLHWTGQTAMIVRLDLEPGPDHAVLIVPTSDEGWIFLEPQTGARIYPAVGGTYRDFTAIEGVYVMRLEWTPVDVYLSHVTDGSANATALSYYAGPWLTEGAK